MRLISNLILSLFILVSVHTAFSQGKPPSSDPQSLIRGRGEGGLGYVRTFKPTTEVEGSSLVYDDPIPGHLYLANGMSTRLEIMNVDLSTQSPLMGVNDRLYEVPTVKLDSVILENEMGKIFNSRFFFKSDDQLVFEVMKGRDYSIYKVMTVQLLKPDYNAALNIGSRNYRYDQNTDYYLRDETSGKMDQLKRLKHLKMLENYDKIKDYVREEDINFKSDEDLSKLGRFLNL